MSDFFGGQFFGGGFFTGGAAPSKEERSGAGGGNWKKKQRRKKFILPNGDVVWATKDEVAQFIALWHELNPGAYVEEPLKPKPVKEVLVVKGEAPKVDYIEFKDPPKPQRMMRLPEGRVFGPGHPLYETVLRELKRRKEEDEFLISILEVI